MAGWLILAALLLLLGLALWRWGRRQWGRSGLPQGQLVGADAEGLYPLRQPYRSEALGLLGRPDYVLRQGEHWIPVEVKTGRTPAGRPFPGHRLQLGAYLCLLEEATGRPPPYGLLRYPEATFQVPFDARLRQEVREALGAMRASLAGGEGPHRHHRDPGRCRQCGYREACDERLA